MPERTPVTRLPRHLPDSSRAQRVRLARAERQLAVALLAALALVVAAFVPGLGSAPGRFPLGAGEAWLAALTLASSLGLWALGVRLGRPPRPDVSGAGPGAGTAPGPAAQHVGGPASRPPHTALEEVTRREIPPAPRSNACC